MFFAREEDGFDIDVASADGGSVGGCVDGKGDWVVAADDHADLGFGVYVFYAVERGDAVEWVEPEWVWVDPEHVMAKGGNVAGTGDEKCALGEVGVASDEISGESGSAGVAYKDDVAGLNFVGEGFDGVG